MYIILQFENFVLLKNPSSTMIEVSLIVIGIAYAGSIKCWV